MRTLSALVLTAALLSGCQTPQAEIRGSFDARQAEAALQPGANTIQGTAFIRKLNGSVVPAAGEVINLVPWTAYAEERFAAIYPRGKFTPIRRLVNVTAADPAYVRLTRQTKADTRGRFTFENVRPGRWYVQTQLIFTENRGDDAGGGLIYDLIEVKGAGNTVDVILSGN